jgi:hypothetical protein
MAQPSSTEKFNLEVTAAELMSIEHALLGQVNKNLDMLPLLCRVRHLLSLPSFSISHGTPLIGDR